MKNHKNHIRPIKYLLHIYNKIWIPFNFLFKKLAPLSPSKINTYSTCPLKYQYSYVNGWEWKKPIAIKLSTAARTVLLQWIIDNKNRLLTDETEKEINRRYNKFCKSIEFGISDDEKEAKEKGLKMILDYINDNSKKSYTKSHVKCKIEAKLNWIPLTTTFDLIITNPDNGKVEITQFKTGKLKTDYRNSYDTQASYLIAKLYFCDKFNGINHYYLGERKNVIVKIDDFLLSEINKRINSIAEDIYNDKYPPSRGALCGWCEFQSRCNTWNGTVTDKERFRLSYTKLMTYMLCPLNYKFLYIDRVPPKPKPFFAFGTVLHNTLEEVYNYDDIYREPPLEYILKIYNSLWTDVGFESAESSKKVYDEGVQVLKIYYDTYIQGKFKRSYATEQYFELPIGKNLLMIRYMDRIDKIGKSYQLLDYKSDLNMRTQDELDKDWQLTIYYWACREQLGLELEKLGLHFLRHNKQIFTVRNSESIKTAQNYIEELADKMMNDKTWEPKKNKYCNHCDHREKCSLVQQEKMVEDGYYDDSEENKITKSETVTPETEKENEDE